MKIAVISDDGATISQHFVTDVNSIDEAVQLYIDGKLTNQMERLH